MKLAGRRRNQPQWLTNRRARAKLVEEQLAKQSRFLFPVKMNGVRTHMILDTYAEISTVPRSFVELHDWPTFRLEQPLVAEMANAQEEPVSEFTIVSLDLDGRKHDCVLYIVPGVKECLFGLDLWGSFGMAISGLPFRYSDDEGVSKDTELVEPKQVVEGGVPHEEAERFLKGIQVHMNQNAQIPENNTCNHPLAEVSLDTGQANPSFKPQYRSVFNRHNRNRIKEIVEEWKRKEVVVPAPPGNLWNSPLLPVPKKDATGYLTDVRLCIDPRSINTLLMDSVMTLPRINELFERLEGFGVASSLDLLSGYNQLPVRDSDQPKLAFTFEGEKLMFQKSPFGIKHLTKHFQQLMEAILQGCEEFVIIYVDDVVIFSKDCDEHIAHVNIVLQRLNQANLKLRLDKCHWCLKELEVLGHLVSGSGRRADHKKIEAMLDFPIPTSTEQLQSFLGLASYLRDYVPEYAKLTQPLERVKGLKTPQAKEFDDPQFREAASALKAAIQFNLKLVNPDDSKPFHIAVDASNMGLGAILYQLDGDTKLIVKLAARSLKGGEKNYSAVRRELKALVFALEEFRPYVHGTDFFVHTDHKPLTYLFTQQQLNPMFFRWIDTLLENSFQLIHEPGSKNVIPDALSRLYPEYVWTREEDQTMKVQDRPVPLLKAIKPLKAKRLRFDDEPSSLVLGQPEEVVSPQEVKRVMDSSYSIAELVKEVSGCTLVDDVEQRRRWVNQAHSLGHKGAQALFQHLLVNEKVFWQGMRNDCELAVRACEKCVRFNVRKKGFSPFQPIHAQAPWDHIALDLAGPFPMSSSGMVYILIVVDVATRFTVLRSISSKSAPSVAAALWDIFALLGPPKIMQSDRGKEFVNSICENLSKFAGTERRFITAYRPNGNGLAERTVRTVKAALFKMCDGAMSHFDSLLPSIQFAVNTSIPRKTNTAPFTLMFGRNANMFSDFSQVESILPSELELIHRANMLREIVFPTVAEVVAEKNTKLKATIDSGRIQASRLPVGSLVFLYNDRKRRKDDPEFEGPFKVVEISSKGAYRLAHPDGELLVGSFNRDKLRLFATPDDPNPYLHQSGGEVSYEVEEVLEQTVDEQGVWYLVRWAGFPESCNSWVHKDDFEQHDIIREFERKRQRASKSVGKGKKRNNKE